MPLMTQLRTPEGELVPLRWGWWHTQVLAEAMATEIAARIPSTDPEEVAYFPAEGTFRFSDSHTFVDASDGEVFPIRPGMTYSAWRE